MGEDTVKLAIWTNLRPQFFLELGQGGGKGGGNLLLQRLAPLCMTELAEHEVIKKEFFELEKGVDGDEAKARSKRLVSTIKRWIVDSDVDTSTQAIRCVKELSEDLDNAKKLLKRGFLPELVKAGSRTELNTKVRVGDNELNTNVSKADASKANMSKVDGGAGGKLLGSINEAEALMFHQESKHIAMHMTTMTVIHLLVRDHIERRSLFLVKGATGFKFATGSF